MAGFAKMPIDIATILYETIAKLKENVSLNPDL